MCQLLVQSLHNAHSRYWNGEDSGELSLQPAVGGSAPPQSKQSVSCCDSWGVLRARFRQHSNLILMTFFTVNMWKLARIYPSGYHVTDLWKRYDITDTQTSLFPCHYLLWLKRATTSSGAVQCVHQVTLWVLLCNWIQWLSAYACRNEDSCRSACVCWRGEATALQERLFV